MTAARALVLALAALAAVELEILLGSRWRVLDATPAIALLVPLALALHGRPRGAPLAIALTCAIAAPFSAEPLPLVPLVWGGIAAGLFAIRDALFRSHPLTEATAAALASFAASAALQLVDLVRFGAPSAGLLVQRALVTGVLTGILAPLAFRAIRAIPVVRDALLPAAR
jgi:hypothetical protein